MKTHRSLSVLSAGLLLACATASQAQNGAPIRFPDGHVEDPVPILHQKGETFTPDTSVEYAGDQGVRSHTNHLVFLSSVGDIKSDPYTRVPGPGADASSQSYYVAETPAAIRQVYSLPSSGGSNVIAIIDVGNYPTALSDFNVFSNYFGLPVETSTNATLSTNKVFQVVYATGTQPAADPGWSQETALDIEWAHAMAPNAKIVLVEAASSSWNDILVAIKKANTLPNVKEMSMSFGSSEFSGETAYDSNFTQSGIVYVASSGDTGGEVIWPGCSPNVVSAGGTDIVRNASGVFTSETGWSDTGGGISRYESRPAYQTAVTSVATKVGTHRGVPDASFDADPASGVYVYDSTSYEGLKGWMVFGGTSVAAPSIAGIINTAATARLSFMTSSSAELSLIYGNLGTANFRDIISGKAGNNSCTVGYDFVTGVGSSLGLVGK